MHSRPPLLALIGVTGYAAIHLDLVRAAVRAGSARLAAAVVINPQEAAGIVTELRELGTAIYASADELFTREAGRIDLCLIPTGIQWHARMTVAALRAGMHVLVEKPLAGSVADCEAIRAAERETGRWVAVGFQDLYAPENIAIKRAIQAGAIGRLLEVKMLGLWPRPRTYFSRNHWAGRREADGAAVLDSPLNNAFAHFVNLALYFAGPGDEAAAVKIESAELFRANRIEMFDTAVVRAVSAQGVRLWFGASHAVSDTHEPEIVLVGEAGQMSWRHEHACSVRTTGCPDKETRLPDAFACRRHMLAAALARLDDSAAPICTTALAARHAAFIEALQDVSSVRTISGELITPIPVADRHGASEIPSVEGLEHAMKLAFAGGDRLASFFSLVAPNPALIGA